MADSKISALPASTTPLAGTEVLPIVQGGATVKVSVANLTAGRAVSATSIKFGSGTVLSSYEEGTWTPTDASGAGLSLVVNTAKYTKVGRLVTVNCYVTYPATVNAASALITLPFAATSFDIATAAASSGAVFSGLTISGAANMSLRAPSLSSILNSQVSGADVIFTCSYMV